MRINIAELRAELAEGGIEESQLQAKGKRKKRPHAARVGKPRDCCWRLGCILPRVPAMIVRTGFSSNPVSVNATTGRVFSVWPPAHIDPSSGEPTRPLEEWQQRLLEKERAAETDGEGGGMRVRLARSALAAALIAADQS